MTVDAGFVRQIFAGNANSVGRAEIAGGNDDGTRFRFLLLTGTGARHYREISRRTLNRRHPLSLPQRNSEVGDH